MKKYEFTGKTINIGRIKLKQIRRLSDGLIGGWIQKESNLSHKDECFVYEDARVYDKARVMDNSAVFGNARVYDSAVIKDDALVSGNALVYGNVRVADSAEVCHDSRVSGDAVLTDSCTILGTSFIFGNASIGGNATVDGNTMVFGNAKVSGTASLFGVTVCSNMKITRPEDLATFSDGYDELVFTPGFIVINCRCYRTSGNFMKNRTWSAAKKSAIEAIINLF
jgi:UDP-3-O-[3-hydroxymyristoyl] glucosamine N-acyltransferase